MNFRNWILQNFPLLEDNFDALTDYELFTKMCSYVLEYSKDNEEMKAKIAEFQTYFDNLDVQEEINNKLDEMASDGTLDELIGNYINPYLQQFNERLNTQDGTINSQNLKLVEQDNKIDSLASGSPLVASSVSQMTDTNRVYVNTTDGNWYYYNGTNWTIGGIYQASEDSELLTNMGKFIPQMVKIIQNNNIIVTLSDTSVTISTSNNTSNAIMINDVNMRSISPTILNKVFLLSEFNIASGRWLLVIQDNILKLLQMNASNFSLNYNDIIIAIITPSEWIYLVPERLTVINSNGYENNYNINYKWFDYEIPKDSYNPIYVTDDQENNQFKIKTLSGKQCIILTQRSFANIDKTSEITVNYENVANNGYGNIIVCIYNRISDTFKCSKLYRDNELRNGSISLNYTKVFGDIILFVYNVASHKVFPFTKEFYLNNELISEDKLINDVNNLNDRINNLSLLRYDFLRCFKKFTGIGDSLMAGYTSVDGHTINSATAKQQENNWFSYLLSRLNRTGTNLSIGSSTVHNWRYGDQAGQPDSNIENANIDTDCYLLGLGVNDLRENLVIGTSSDINSNDYTQNANTFYGNYDYLINKLKSFNPYAKIFVFTIPNSETNANNYNEAIRYIANLYNNVYCIDLYTLYNYNEGFINNNLSSGHYNPITYNYMSMLIENAINNYIFNNYESFNLIPYNY